MSFHGHSCPSIMIICIQSQTWGMARHVFFLFFWATGMVPPPGVGALCKRRTLHIGNGGTEHESHFYTGSTHEKNKKPCQAILVSNISLLKGIVHFEIKIWYLSAYPKGIQDVGVFFSSVDPILMFLGQTVLVCQSYNGRYRSLSL